MTFFRMLAPNKNWLPCLAIKTKIGRLVFGNCSKCIEEENVTAECHHNKNDRLLKGTWWTDELRLALKMGYTCEHICEFCTYVHTLYI